MLYCNLVDEYKQCYNGECRYFLQMIYGTQSKDNKNRLFDGSAQTHLGIYRIREQQHRQYPQRRRRRRRRRRKQNFFCYFRFLAT